MAAFCHARHVLPAECCSVEKFLYGCAAFVTRTWQDALSNSDFSLLTAQVRKQATTIMGRPLFSLARSST